MILLPTQGPPSILSAQRTGPTSTEGLLPTQGLLQSSQHRVPSGTEGPLSAQGPHLGGTGASSRRYVASSRHRGLPQSPQHRGVGPFGIVSLLPTQGSPPILSAQKTFRHRGPPLGTAASSRRHRGLLSAVRGLLSAAQGPLLSIGASFNPLSTEDRTYQHRGPPLCTGASFRHMGLPQSPQHRGVGPFGIVSLLPTQGPPPILSAQKTIRHRGPPFGTGASSRRYGASSRRHGASSQRHKGLLSV